MNVLMATEPEKAVYNALVRLGYVPDQDFQFQSKMLGGRSQRGGLVGDFYLPEYSLLIDVQGEYWHSNPETMSRDRIQRVTLESQGIRVIYIDAEDALRNATFYVQEALKGISHSRFGD